MNMKMNMNMKMKMKTRASNPRMQFIVLLLWCAFASSYAVDDKDHEGAKENAMRIVQENKGKDFSEGDMKIPLPKVVPGRAYGAVVMGKWPGGVVPYVLQSNLNNKAKDAITAAIQHIQERTCVRIVPRKQERDYVLFVQEGGCWSFVGDIHMGAQKLSLGFGCEYKGIAVHEILHALGFVHEQSRKDRDNYIKIILANIQTGFAPQFQISRYAEDLGQPYDYASIMHYSRFAFSKNRLPTIVTKDPKAIIGQRTGLSKIDIKQVRKMYQCDDSTTPPATTTSPPTTTTTPPPTTTTTPPPTTTTTPPPTTTTTPPPTTTTTTPPPTTTTTPPPTTTTTPPPTTTTTPPPPATTTPPPTTTTTPPPTSTTSTPSSEVVKVKLTGGRHPNEGRVEIRRGDGPWGTICDKGWDKKDADVVCKMLKYRRAVRASWCSEFDYGANQVQKKTLLSDVECTGSEDSIASCRSSEWGEPSRCGYYHNAGVVCEDDKITASQTIRLAGGRRPNEGRLEVFYNGAWGTVCDRTWTKRDANVACKQLGFASFGAFAAKPNAYFGEGTGPIAMSSVQCYGSEQRLTECIFRRTNRFNRCDHSRDVGVVCNTCQHGAEGAIKFSWSSIPNEPRAIEIFHNNRWGRICGDSWGINEADVACRQMGYPQGALRSATFDHNGIHRGSILITGVKCSGNERSLAECPSSGRVDKNSCQGKIAGALCNPLGHISVYTNFMHNLFGDTSV